MTAPQYVVAIDNGSQSVKVLVVDPSGRVHASAQRQLRATIAPAAGQVVHPDDDIWDTIAATTREALGRFTGDPAHLVGVGLCTIRFCRALLDERGALAEPLLSWMDERVSRPHEPDPRVRWVTTSSGYVTLRLTGEHRDSAANQQGLWPVDQQTWQWSDDPADYQRTGVHPDQLFELVDPGALLGTVTPAASSATGLPEGLPVFATGNDKAVEALGSGVRGDDVLLSLGTYIAAMTAGSNPRARSDSDPGAYWVNFGARPGQYLYESAGIRRGMWTVTWWRQLLGTGAPIREEELDGGAEEVPPGSGGLLAVLDWLAPAGAPYRRGALLGFDGTQGRFHVHRAILEGIALTMREHVDAMNDALGRDSGELVISGGGSRSALMMQILAAVFERTVRRNELTDAAGMGAAICALVGSGVHPDWDAAVEATVRVADRFGPDPGWAAAYRGVRARHALILDHLDPLFRALAAAPEAR